MDLLLLYSDRHFKYMNLGSSAAAKLSQVGRFFLHWSRFSVNAFFKLYNAGNTTGQDMYFPP